MRAQEVRLFTLASLGSAEEIETLLREEPDINIKARGLIGTEQYTPLIIAAEGGHAKVVEILLSKYQEPSIVNRIISWVAGTSYKFEFIIALGKAARKGHIEVVKLLLNKGLDLNKQNKDCETLLMTAAKNGHTEIVIELLSKGANPNSEDKNKNTALIYAAANGHKEILEILLDKKLKKSFLIKISELFLGWFIKPKNSEAEYNKAFLKAVENGRKETAEMLLSKDLNINIQGALISAARIGSMKLLNMALDKGLNPDEQDTYGYSALMYAVENGHKKVVEKLLNEKTNVNAYCKNNRTLLMLAAERGHLDVVKLLLDKGADINKIKYSNLSALTFAVENRHKKVVELLLDNGANPNTRDVHNSETPLMLAAKNGEFEIATLLIKSGADISVKNSKGKTAKELTTHIAIRKLLEEFDSYRQAQKEKLPSLLNIATQYISNCLVKDQHFKKSYKICKEQSRLTSEAIEIINDSIPDGTSATSMPYNPTKSMLNNWAARIDGELNLLNWVPLGKVENIKCLLKSVEGIDINVQCENGLTTSYTPLMLAVDKTPLILMEMGLRSPFGLRGLHSTTSIKTVVTLLKAGADPDIVNKDGKTAKDLTRSKNIKQLLEKVSEYRRTIQEEARTQGIPFSIDKKLISSWSKQIEQESAASQVIQLSG